jgi:predicted transcriptional regulator
LNNSWNDALISIHPEHADAILAGKKTIELRRRLPHLKPDIDLWIYATMPTGAVVGWTTVKMIVRAHPDTIWEHYKKSTGLKRKAFYDYFDGASDAFAVVLGSTRRVKPITIQVLRSKLPNFYVPQVVRILKGNEVTALGRLASK